MSHEDEILFECSLSSSRNIRVLAASLHCLGKLGKEFTIEATIPSKTLTLRFVNDAKTSFVAFEYKEEFFESFSVALSEGVTVKLKLKSCLAVFRNLRIIERLEISLVKIGSSKHVVIFRAECQGQVTKTHQFYFEDAEALDPQFDRETKHQIRARPKLLLEALKHIHGTDEIEITANAGLELKVTSQHHNMKTSNANKTVMTEMIIPKQDFEMFEIAEISTKLIFSVREFRVLLTFCESNKVDIADVLFLFNEPGTPLMLTSLISDEVVTTPQLENEVKPHSFSFTLVLSTIPEGPSQNSQSQSQAEIS